jgi:predicted ester cyclase
MSTAQTIASRYYAGVIARDPEAAIAVLAADSVVEIPGATLHGPAPVAGWMQSFFMAFPDLEHEVRPLESAGDVVRTTLRIRGTHTGPLVSPAGTIPATGRTIDIEAANELQIAGEHVARLTIRFDPGAMMAQLGVAGRTGSP